MTQPRERKTSLPRRPCLILFAAAIYASLSSICIHFFLSAKPRLSEDYLLLKLLGARHTFRRPLRYDQAGIRPIRGSERSHSLPNAVPESRTIPRQLAENRTFHLTQRINTTGPSIPEPNKKHGHFDWNHSYATDFRTLYLYNPSVLPLHNTLVSTGSDGDLLSETDLAALTGGDPTVRYVVTYRAYLGCNCFGFDPKREIMNAGEQISYLAIALLDHKLDVVPGSDTLFDLNAGPGYGRYFRQFREDCRVFLIRGSIHLLCNDNILRVRLRRVTDKGGNSGIDTAAFGTKDENRVPYIYSNIHGNGLELTLLEIPRRLEGKNLNMFRTHTNLNESDANSNMSKYDYYLQTYPLPHRFKQIHVPKHGDNLIFKHEEESTAGLPPSSFATPDVNFKRTLCNVEDADTADNFKGFEEEDNCTNVGTKDVNFFPDDEHGSACCLSIVLEGKDVLVGITHLKLDIRKPWHQRDIYKRYHNHPHRQFVSRFVAYQPNPPFDIVALGGHFCLGFASDEEGMREGGNSLAGRNMEHRLDLLNETYDCPNIHFISGLAEYVGDPTKVIISYGVNDCYPRMFVAEKEDIVRNLLGQI